MENGERPSGRSQSAEWVDDGESAPITMEPSGETRGARFARKAHRTRLYIYAGVAAVLLVSLTALVLANTAHVQVSWVFGTSSISLVWLVLIAAILGVLLGMVLGALFHWRTREPRS